MEQDAQSPDAPLPDSPEGDAEGEPLGSFWARVASTAGDRKVWLRILLRGALFALLPGLLAFSAGYSYLIPTLVMVFGVVGGMTFAERVVSRARPVQVGVTGFGLILVAWVLLTLGALEVTYLHAVLKGGDVGAGVSALTGHLDRLLQGELGAIEPLVALFYLAGALGLASTALASPRDWNDQGPSVLFLLAGHGLLSGLVPLALKGGPVMPDEAVAGIVCPLLGTILLVFVFYLVCRGVELAVEPKSRPPTWSAFMGKWAAETDQNRPEGTEDSAP